MWYYQTFDLDKHLIDSTNGVCVGRGGGSVRGNLFETIAIFFFFLITLFDAGGAKLNLFIYFFK